MPEFFLRMEGMNLGWFVTDTNDLSTTRGGSQLLNLAPKRVEDRFPKLQGRSISTGASAAIFRFQADNGEERALLKEVREFLKTHDQLKHATFVVDIVPASAGDFDQIRESLLAANRHRQMISPSFAIPSSEAIEVCKKDGVRPGDRSVAFPDGTFSVSESVAMRREFGREEKRNLLPRLAGEELGGGLGLVEHLKELTGKPPAKYKHLIHKMAVLYLDGNGFGEIQRQLAKTPKRQEEFDNAIQGKSREFLRALVQAARIRTDLWFHQDGLRLEVFVLAGDEIRLFVPAWVGWRALEIVFQAAHGSSFPQKPEADETPRDLTYKAGLVFCHHNAPIQRMLSLGHELAEYAKKNAPTPIKGRNVFAYQVMESFDIVAADLDKIRVRRFLPGAGLEQQVLGGDQMEDIAKLVQHVRNHFPRNKLHRIVELFACGRREEARKLAQSEIRDLGEPERSIIEGRTVLAGDAGWFHLLELWDYALNHEDAN